MPFDFGTGAEHVFEFEFNGTPYFLTYQ